MKAGDRHLRASRSPPDLRWLPAILSLPSDSTPPDRSDRMTCGPLWRDGIERFPGARRERPAERPPAHGLSTTEDGPTSPVAPHDEAACSDLDAWRSTPLPDRKRPETPRLSSPPTGE